MPATSHFAPSDQLSTLLHPEKKMVEEKGRSVHERDVAERGAGE